VVNAGGQGPTLADRCAGVVVSGNTEYGLPISAGTFIISSGANPIVQPGNQNFFYGSGWMTNITVTGNNSGGNGIVAGTYNEGFQYALAGTNNQYYPRLDVSGTTNVGISYSTGSRYAIIDNYTTETVYLSSSDAQYIPGGAQMWLSNGTFNAATIPVYLNSNLAGQTTSLNPGQVLQVNWNQLTYQWQTNPVTQSGSLGTYVSGIIAKGVIMR
jgi:hypothetical protein